MTVKAKTMLPMVDLKGQYRKIKSEIDASIQECLDSAAFINGAHVKSFQKNLEFYLNVKHVIPCANGTDALQIAMMALALQVDDEVIVPAFTYVATAEVIALLKLKPIMVDVDPKTFNITAEIIEKAITPRTKAIVPVHLFGQSCDMEAIMAVAEKHNLYVIEDNAQAIGADYNFSNGQKAKTGTIGHIGCTSFFPSKNLGCYGDGGAIMTNDDDLAAKLRMMANHGQSRQYYHDSIGVNSRLDSIQAGILDVKLRHLDEYSAARQQAAAYYDAAFAQIEGLETPARQHNSTHVFHQYTLKVKNGQRAALRTYLTEGGVSAMIYYPMPLYKQTAYAHYWQGGELPVTEELCDEVMSLPIHTEMTEETLAYITETVKSFFDK
ncbi:MAG: DegT/DnrJ/EryC1/StrS family aminotransferase [Saprospiraceae bacterium]|nr:DegT/DnrJ/EryC1/StrS family aminotransferase [Saprospiraceae bacterium]